MVRVIVVKHQVSGLLLLLLLLLLLRSDAESERRVGPVLGREAKRLLAGPGVETRHAALARRKDVKGQALHGQALGARHESAVRLFRSAARSLARDDHLHVVVVVVVVDAAALVLAVLVALVVVFADGGRGVVDDGRAKKRAAERCNNNKNNNESSRK